MTLNSPLIYPRVVGKQAVVDDRAQRLDADQRAAADDDHQPDIHEQKAADDQRDANRHHKQQHGDERAFRVQHVLPERGHRYSERLSF